MIGDLGGYASLRVVENPSLLVSYEDWSQVRSPARARRRRHKHPQRIVIRQKPDPTIYRMDNTLILHPAVADQLKRGDRP